MAEKTRVICVGEVMIELARGADNRYGLSFGGDTFNTAVYLARAGIPAAYASAMGERKFYYWRDTSPARELFELPNWAAIAEALLSARLVYFSGVTLSLYSNTGIGRFLA